MIDERSYGTLDKMLHHVAFNRAFGGIGVQKHLAEIEETLMIRDTAALPATKRPVFIAGLPRAGTTLLLNLLSRAPEFATHTYRDMPFVLAPMLWNRLSGPFRKPADERERAHGDGVAVGYDSPEAFEEILWLAFWRDKYRDDHIELWKETDRNEAFESFFRRHIEKLVATRTRDRRPNGAVAAPSRYLSKNNANIARLRLLPAIFPDGRVVVPIRDPDSQSRSLLRQHLRFTKIHDEDAFARRYMSWLGHFEFGRELRPIRFDEGSEGAATGNPEDIDFWLSNWIAAHQEILAAGDRVILFDFAALCAQPRRSLEQLAESLDIEHVDTVLAGADRIKSSPGRPTPDNPHDTARYRRACEIFAAARDRCVNHPRAASRS
ncbi:MAG: sulfotransferase [Rhodospirillales bacterium]